MKITAKFRASRNLRFEDTKGSMSPEKFRDFRETGPRRVMRPKSFGTFESDAFLLANELLFLPSEPRASLIFSNGRDIRQISTDGSEYKKTVPDLKNAGSLDFDFKTSTIYWLETREKKVQRARIGQNIAPKVDNVLENGMPCATKIAVDWVGRKMYWACRGELGPNVPFHRKVSRFFCKVMVSRNGFEYRGYHVAELPRDAGSATRPRGDRACVECVYI